MDPHGVPLHEATLEGEVPDGIDVVGLDHGEDDVVGTEDAQRDDVDAELLAELGDLSGTVSQYLPRQSVRSRAEVRRVLGGDGEGRHDYLLLTVGCGRERMRRARARKVADVAPSVRRSAGVIAVSISSIGNPPTCAGGTAI